MPYSSAQNAAEYNMMTLTGEGEVTAIPDTAILRLGVQTTGDNLSDAQQENARLSQAVLESLKQLGITDIKTFQYEINKLIEYENGNRIDKGYSVRNILEVSSNNLDQIGELIDTAVRNGANVVDLITFEVSDSDQYYFQALNLAVMNAFEKAQSIMEGLGIMALPVPKHITENTTFPTPFQSIGLREGAFTTPIEAGNMPIKASVTVEFMY